MMLDGEAEGEARGGCDLYSATPHTCRHGSFMAIGIQLGEP